MNMIRIEIDAEVQLAISNNRQLGETDNDVVRRLLGFDGRRSRTPIGRNAGSARPKSIKELLDADAIQVGEKLSWTLKGHRPLHAIVEADGTMAVDGLGRFTSPSGAPRQFTGSEQNGWIQWRIDRTGETLHQARTRVQLERTRPQE